MVPSFSTSQTSFGSSPFTKQPVADITFGVSLPDWVCASPVVGPRLDAKTRVANNFIQEVSILFLQKDVISADWREPNHRLGFHSIAFNSFAILLGRNS